ncbi:MAG: winged helix-turn-helix transcriptional regulator [Thermoplasmata archaeon]
MSAVAVPDRALRPETLDLDILREMSRGGAPNLAGIDPRLNATRIARRLRIGRPRVAARLKAWKESGFLTRYDVWLNPALFGWQGAWVSVRVKHPRVKRELFPRLALIDGAVSGLELLGEWITLGLVTPDLASLNRTVTLIRGLAGVEEVEPPVPWRLPEPRRQLTPLDIRIVRALREHPTAALGETARRVGISTRTMTRRYADLVDGWAVWFVPMFDFHAVTSPVVSLLVNVTPGTRLPNVVRQVRAKYPLTLEFPTADVGPQLGENAEFLVVLPPSTAHLEELEQFVCGIPGIAGIDSSVMVQNHSFPGWFDRHLESLARPPA